MEDEHIPETPVAIILLAGFQGGGTERAVAALLETRPPGTRFCLVTNSGPENDRYPMEAPVERLALGVDIDEEALAGVGFFRGLPRVIRLLSRTRATIRQRDVSVVVSFLTTANLLAVIATRGLSVKVVLSERNDTSRQHHPRPTRVARWLLYRFADIVTANTQVALEDMRRYVPAHKLRLMPNAVTIPTKRADPGHSQLLLTVGRLVDHKQQSLVIEGFARSAATRPDWSLEVIGDGPELDRLKSLAAHCGVSDQVRFTGFVPDPTSSYLGAGIFVSASRYEGMPNSILEAMAAGLPCVVPDELPGALTVVEHRVSGLVFRAGDVRDLRDKLILLMDDAALRARLGAEARRRMQDYSPERMSRLWGEVLR